MFKPFHKEFRPVSPTLVYGNRYAEYMRFGSYDALVAEQASDFPLIARRRLFDYVYYLGCAKVVGATGLHELVIARALAGLRIKPDARKILAHFVDDECPP